MQDDTEHERDIGKLWGEIREQKGVIDSLRTWVEGQIEQVIIVLYGVDKNNGFNSKINALGTRMDKLDKRHDLFEHRFRKAIAWGRKEARAKHLPGGCVGKTALDNYIALRKKEAEDVKKAMYALYGSVLVALISAGAAIYVARTAQETNREIAAMTLALTAQSSSRYPSKTP